MIRSSLLREPWVLKDWNSLSLGGNWKGDAPKLNLHCWKDMKLAAAKNFKSSLPPSDKLWKILSYAGIRVPLRLKMASERLKSSRAPITSPDCQRGMSWTVLTASCLRGWKNSYFFHERECRLMFYTGKLNQNQMLLRCRLGSDRLIGIFKGSKAWWGS